MTQHPMSITEKVFLALLPALLLFTRVLADITVLLVALSFLWHCKHSKQWEWAKTWWFKSVWLFWAYLLLINLPFSIDSKDSLLYAITFIRWPLFMLALGLWLLVDKDRQRWFITSLILTSIFIVSDTVWQYVNGVDWFGITQLREDRLTGPFRNQIPGTMMLRVWFIMAFAIFLLPILKQQNRQFTSLLLLMLAGLGFIFITGERMAFIVFCTGSVLTLIGMWLHFHQQRKELIIGFIVICAAFIAVTLTDADMMQRTIFSIFDKLNHFYDSDYGFVFRAAFAAWQEYPVFGSGLHTYKSVCNEMGVLAAISKSVMECTHPHNLYLHLMAETGLVGLTLFSIMLSALYIRILKPQIEAKNWLLAILCFTVMTASFFPLIGGKSVLNNWVASLVWLGMGWCLAISAWSQQKPARQSASVDHQP